MQVGRYIKENRVEFEMAVLKRGDRQVEAVKRRNKIALILLIGIDLLDPGVVICQLGFANIGVDVQAVSVCLRVVAVWTDRLDRLYHFSVILLSADPAKGQGIPRIDDKREMNARVAGFKTVEGDPFTIFDDRKPGAGGRQIGGGEVFPFEIKLDRWEIARICPGDLEVRIRRLRVANVVKRKDSLQ